MALKTAGIGVALALAVSALAGCAPAETAEPDSSTAPVEQVGTARIAVTGAVAMHRLPLHVADELGFFEDVGVELALEEIATSAVPAALVSGSIDYAYFGLGSTVALRAEGQDVVAFAGTHQQNPNLIVITQELADAKGVTEDSSLSEKVEALRGATIAVTSPGGSLDLTLRYVAISNGLDPDRDFTIAYLRDIGTFVAAMQQGQIDGFLSASPVGETAIVNDLAIPFINLLQGDAPILDGMLFEALMGTQQTLDEKPELAEAVTRAIWMALDALANDPEGTKAAVRHVFDNVEDEVFDMAWDMNLPSYSETPRMNDAGVKVTTDMIAATEPDQNPVAPGDVYTNKFVDAVAADFE